jgi:hypothetical protein
MEVVAFDSSLMEDWTLEGAQFSAQRMPARRFSGYSNFVGFTLQAGRRSPWASCL